MSVKFRILTAFLTALLMSMCMSLVMTLVNLGLRDIFLQEWLKAWALSAAVAFPLSYFLPPRVNKLVRKLGLK